MLRPPALALFDAPEYHGPARASIATASGGPLAAQPIIQIGAVKL